MYDMTFKVLTVSLLMIFCTGPVYADIYKCVDKQGRVSFTQTPCPVGLTTMHAVRTSPDAGVPGLVIEGDVEGLSPFAQKLTSDTASVIVVGGKSRVNLPVSSLKSLRNGRFSAGNELVISQSTRIDFTTMKRLEVLGPKGGGLEVKIELLDGAARIDLVEGPMLYLVGTTKVGQFKQPLDRIKSIDFR